METELHISLLSCSGIIGFIGLLLLVFKGLFYRPKEEAFDPESGAPIE